MKNVKIEVNISNGDVSTMLVEGHLEKLQAERSELKQVLTLREDKFKTLMSDLDDSLAKSAEPVLNKLRTAFSLLGSAYKVELRAFTTWRQAAKQGVKFDFSYEQRNKKNLTPDSLTFDWLARVFDFSSPFYVDTFGLGYPTLSGDEIPDDHVCLPFVTLGYPHTRGKFNHNPFGRVNSFVPVSEDAKKMAEEAKGVAQEIREVRANISALTNEIDNPEAITRKVTARLTQATLSQSGDLAFMRNILEAVEKPLLLGKNDEQNEN